MSGKNGDKYAKMAVKAFKEAVKEALKYHAKMGVPAVFEKGGKLCYQLPSGRIVTKLC